MFLGDDFCLKFVVFILDLQCRKHKDLYLWMSKCPNGPSVKFLVNAGNLVYLTLNQSDSGQFTNQKANTVILHKQFVDLLSFV